ncbi:alpha/beta fold hydrolase [Nocardia jejuensis]|uniref:alpha/beta fold hydrolase n=1 Tax=Nocardia jejuensis TaxID=328049 RepID=UPI00083633E9|nr:alpha/beta hydrolase [Nocardia jejuensis]
MAEKLSAFKNDRARAEYMRAYETLERRWPIPAATVDIATSFGSTHVRHSGSGTETPLVLLHSFGANSLYWGFLIEELCGDRVVYMPEMVGAAGRSVQTAPMRETDFAIWFDEVLDALGLDRVHVVGYSHGAWHAVAAALHGAKRLESMTLVEPGGVFDKPTWGVLLKMIRFGMRKKTDENMRALAAWMTPGLDPTPEEFALGKAALATFHMRIGWARLLKDAELQTITVPTLAIFGGDSVVSRGPLAAARRVTDHMPDAETEVYPGTGHAIFDQIPEEIVRRILTFVRQRDAARIRDLG